MTPIKKLFQITIFILATIVFVADITEADIAYSGDPINGTVLPFFDALGAGDVQRIETYLTGDFAKAMSPILRDNQAYPDTLRDQYEGSRVQIGDITGSEFRLFVEVLVSFNDGKSSTVLLTLIKQEDDTWKIVDQAQGSLNRK